MDTKRMLLYQELESRTGKTPLVQYRGRVPNGNRILVKRECDNPFGSHYDRVYLSLYRHWESEGRIKPGDSVFETSSGSAGVAFAGIGRMLGYKCHVGIPAGGELKRERAIIGQGAELHMTPADNYIAGFPKWVLEFRKRTGYFFMNHSMHRGGNNEWTLAALGGIATEALECSKVDCFLPAVGNGSSVLGPGRVFRRLSPETRVVAFETFQSAVAFDMMNPGGYEARFGIAPGTLSRHRLPGTSYNGIDFPHIRGAAEGVIDEVVLVSDPQIDREYRRITGREDTKGLPHWNIGLECQKDLGRSSMAGIAVALMVAERICDKVLLVIGYDKMDRYDTAVPVS